MNKDIANIFDRAPVGESKAGGNTLLAKLGFADKDRQTPRHDLACGFVRDNAIAILNAAIPSRGEGHREVATASMEMEVKVCSPDLRNRHHPSPFIVGFADGILRYYRYSEEVKLPDFSWCRRNGYGEYTTELEHYPVRWQVFNSYLEHQLLPWRRAQRDKIPFRDMHSKENLALAAAGGVEEEAVRAEMSAIEAACRKEKPKSVAGPVPFDKQINSEIIMIMEVKITPEPAGNVIRQIEAYRGGITDKGIHLGNRPALLVCDYDISMSEADALKSKDINVIRLGARFDAYVQEQTSTRAKLTSF